MSALSTTDHLRRVLATCDMELPVRLAVPHPLGGRPDVEFTIVDLDACEDTAFIWAEHDPPCGITYVHQLMRWLPPDRDFELVVDVEAGPLGGDEADPYTVEIYGISEHEDAVVLQARPKKH